MLSSGATVFLAAVLVVGSSASSRLQLLPMPLAPLAITRGTCNLPATTDVVGTRALASGAQVQINHLQLCATSACTTPLWTGRGTLTAQLCAATGALPIGAYHYRVSVEDDAGERTPWSNSQPFTVAPAPSDMADASWICSSAKATDTGTTMLRTNITLGAGKTPTSALLSVVGLGQFFVELNGVKVGNDAVAPAWSNWRKRTLFNAYDVTASLRPAPATNAFLVYLGNGMYNVPTPPGGRYTKFVGSFGPRMLFFQLDVTYGDGRFFHSNRTGSSYSLTCTSDRAHYYATPLDKITIFPHSLPRLNGHIRVCARTRGGMDRH